jgi:hypothetical protein
MSDSPFLHLGAKELANMISQASQQVLYCAPGITQSIAALLVNAFKRIGAGKVHVVLDVDDVTARLGYGDFDAVTMLAEEGLHVRVEPGLRVSVVVCDSVGYLFTTPPMLVEMQDEKHVGVNAVRMSPEQVSEIFKAVAPSKDSDPESTPAPQIGRESLTDERAQAVMTALEANPPQKFDLARKVNVFNSFIEFVELRLTGLHIKRHTVTLPRRLVIALRSEATAKRLLTTFRLVDADSKVAKEAAQIDFKVRQLREKFTRSLGDDLGNVMLRAKRIEFSKAVDALKAEIENFQCKIVERLQKEIDNSLKELVEGLLPAVRKTIPEGLEGEITGKPTTEVLRRFIEVELRKVFPEAKDLIKEMKLEWIPKGVTYETLSDETFQNRVREQFPYVDWKQPFAEFEAAPATASAQSLIPRLGV